MNLPLDISRCTNDECLLRETCARWTERDNGRVLSCLVPNEDGTCDDHIPNSDVDAEDPA